MNDYLPSSGTDERVHLSQACRNLIPEFYGAAVSPMTATRWVNRGLIAADGRRVKLKAFRAGRQLVTSREWIREFFDQLAGTSVDEWRRSDEVDDAATAARLKAAGLV